MWELASVLNFLHVSSIPCLVLFLFSYYEALVFVRNLWVLSVIGFQAAFEYSCGVLGGGV